MCGIFGFAGRNPRASEIVLEGLKKLEYRGYDSWGIAVPAGNQIKIKKEVGFIGNPDLGSLPKATMAIGHTRWATHGGVTRINAHPHLDCRKTLAVIHNGIIENYAEIRDRLIKKGHKFISQTDTEVAAHLIEEYYQTPGKDSFLKACARAFKEFKGLNAIIVLDNISRSIIACKNGSPLIIGKGKGENFLASDAHAILSHSRDLYFMEEEEIIIIDDREVRFFNLDGLKEKKISFTRVDWNTDEAEKGDLPHFMLKEIFDQPKIISSLSVQGEGEIIKFADLIKKSFGTYLVGCGTAAYACLAGTYIFSKIAKKHLNFAYASEFVYLIDFITDKSLVVGLSQSGETIDLIDALKKARQKEAKIGAIVNVIGSSLFRMADFKLLLNAGTEKAVVSTKAFTAKLANLILIAYQLNSEYQSGVKLLKKTVLALEKILSQESLKKIKKLSLDLSKKDNIYIIGRGVSYPIALEAALKIKEASYIHAEAFAGGELKHGVIALIEKNTPCIGFLTNDETYSDTLSGLMEMKARGGHIIGIGYKNHEILDEFVFVPDLGIASGIAQVVVAQLIGYYLSVIKGYNPDKPRNLAKSVVVK